MITNTTSATASQLALLQASLLPTPLLNYVHQGGGHRHQHTYQLSHNCLKVQLIVLSAIAEWPLTELLHFIIYSYSIIKGVYTPQKGEVGMHPT